MKTLVIATLLLALALLIALLASGCQSPQQATPSCNTNQPPCRVESDPYTVGTQAWYEKWRK